MCFQLSRSNNTRIKRTPKIEIFIMFVPIQALINNTPYMKTRKNYLILANARLPLYQGAAYYLLNPRNKQGQPRTVVGADEPLNSDQVPPIKGAIICRTVAHDIAIFRWAKASGTQLIRQTHCAWVYYVAPRGEITATMIKEILS